ncbi:glycosyltransferase family 2 protein [Leucobacter chromiisoli]|uniref:glycosyltransferase family 2 protein n=1 Tax=Leucobacter chromiisoli TaxID=2796471 RepID=UPI00190537F4|nr:glycosyltransferase family A protein [Leucobacter chromiisoli]
MVIPTVGRPELARALDSVRRQDYQGQIEVIVVADRPEGTVDEELLEGADVVLYTGGGKRAGAARNLGIAHSTHPYVALLDDDDEWLSWKLSAQMPEFAATGAEVIGTQAVYRNANTGTASPPVPTRVKQATQTYAEYLFRKRSATVGRPVIFGITLIVSTELARRVKWDETLSRHQDWDWVDRMERQGATVLQLPQASAIVWTGSEGSISSAPDWRASLAWAESRRGAWAPEVLVDFLAGQVLRYALQARSPSGVLRSLAAMARARRFPSIQCLTLGFVGIVPRAFINKRMTKQR